MSVQQEGELVRLVGDCRVEDAEALCATLVGRRIRRVDVSGAQRLHTAVVQALMALDAEVIGRPADAFQERQLARVLHRPLP